MARRKRLSLEEARKLGRLDRFAEEHPSEVDAELFERLLDAMTRTPEADSKTPPADEAIE